MKNVDVVDPVADPAGFEKLLVDGLGEAGALDDRRAPRPCILAAADIRKYEKAAADACGSCAEARPMP